jgi:hypothetical protein
MVTTKDQLAEIEKDIEDSLEQGEYNLNYARKEGFLLGTISQLKEELENWRKAYKKQEVIFGTDIEDFINTQGKKIKADLKFYEDKLKELEK